MNGCCARRGVGDLTEYRTLDRDPIPRLVVIDRRVRRRWPRTSLTSWPRWSAIAQRGRSLGVHVVLATQRPAGVVTDDIRANTDLRHRVAGQRSGRGASTSWATRCRRPSRSRGRVARGAARTRRAGRVPSGATRRPTLPAVIGVLTVRPFAGSGHAGPSPLAGAVDPPGDELSALSNAIGVAAEMTQSVADASATVARTAPDGVRPPARSAESCRRADPAAAFGLHDAIGSSTIPPGRQRRPPALGHRRRQPAARRGARIGPDVDDGRRSPRRCAGHPRPDDLHLYVIDGYGDRALDGLAQIAHCGGVVRLGESEADRPAAPPARRRDRSGRTLRSQRRRSDDRAVRGRPG